VTQMKVVRPPFQGVPILCIDEFLEPLEAQLVLRKCLTLRTEFEPGKVINGPFSATLDPSWRTNDTVRDGLMLREVRSILRSRIWTEECRRIWHEGYYLFDVINYATSHEVVISRYGKGEFYKKHQDITWDRVQRRIITLVYYINKEPKRFGGGQLNLWDRDKRITIEPRNNLVVVFPSFAFHEVEMVEVDGEEWDTARFSVNYWLGFN